jgi:hypothetical protein
MAFHLGCAYFSLKPNATPPSDHDSQCDRNLTLWRRQAPQSCSLCCHPSRIGSAVRCPDSLQVSRNSLQSRPCPNSMRISHFLATVFDEMPGLVSPTEFVRGSFEPFQLRTSDSGELSNRSRDCHCQWTVCSVPHILDSAEWTCRSCFRQSNDNGTASANEAVKRKPNQIESRAAK